MPSTPDRTSSAASKLEQERDAMSGALQTIYRLATSGTGVAGSIMQQIADAAYNALTVGEDRV